MTWLRLDDGFLEHPKVAGLSDVALRLYLEMLLYSARTLSDGRVRNVRQMLPTMRRRLRRDPMQELITSRLVSQRENGTYVIHDFLDYNPSRQAVLTRRRAVAERVQRHREGQRNAVTNTVTSKPVTPLVTPPPAPTPAPTPKSTSLGPRKRDPIWDALADWMGQQPQTSSERGAWNKAAKELRDIGADPADIASRGQAYETRYNVAKTPNGLVKHWSELNGSRPIEAEPFDPDWMFKPVGGDDVR